MVERIKVLLVDDELLIRNGLSMMLSLFDDLSIVGTASNGYEALEFCKAHSVDLVLMDIRMPECDGVLGTRLVKEAFPHTKVLILTTFKDSDYIYEALQYGASGYLLKDSSHEVIHEGIKSAMLHQVVIHPDVASQILSTPAASAKEPAFENSYRLSEKEILIIKEIANGLSNKEISEALFLSEGTIKNHVTNILYKLELRDRTQIAIFAFRNGLV
ncbi:MAG TPA: DNA-binding response regulator [Firmicutes bacterium]|nr:DNA-binding response regulator [Bacillota bacterium]